MPHVLGIDFSITNEVVLLWIAALITFLLLTLACRRKSLVPRGSFQNLFEAMIDFVEKDVARGGMGEAGASWAPFLLALFFFILFCNLLGMVPLPGHIQAATANINVTGGLAVMVFGLTVVTGLRRHGLTGFLRSFVPPGIPRWVAVLVAPIEVITWLAKPLSLAVRLFANMVVGHTLIFVFIALEMTAFWLLKPLPLVGAVAMECFEIFVCLIQAFIFTLLASMYIREAMEPH